MEQALDKRAVISTLTRSFHGDLKQYLQVAVPAATQEPDFYAHLIAWNARKGEVRDAQVALPVIALRDQRLVVRASYAENALAHIAALGPREFARAVAFSREAQAHGNTVRRLVERYLRDIERGPFARFEGLALQHRRTLRGLYATYHVKPTETANTLIVRGHGGTPKADILRSLGTLSPIAAAQAVIESGVSFLIARGALGKKATDPDVLLALIERMSPTDLVTNMKWLETAGVKRVPALRAALEARLEESAKRKPKSQSLKAARAAESVGDTVLATKLHALQEKQLDASARIEGDWLVLGDKSGSMAQAIEIARQVSAILSRMVKGKVYLVFFDTDPVFYDVTGKTLDAITALTRGVHASGGTSIGCGLKLLVERGLGVDGIAVVSDGGENQLPFFMTAYAAYQKRFSQDPSVYFYRTLGDLNVFTRRLAQAQIDVSEFDLTGPSDYSSLPNIVQTMRVGKYGLLDEIMATPLRRLDEVLTYTKGMEVLRGTDRPAQEGGDRDALVGRRGGASDAGEGAAGRVSAAKPTGARGARRRPPLVGA